jgi:hypothetical protein
MDPRREAELLTQGTALANRCVQSKVLENQLAMVVAHLRRHRSIAQTRALLKHLPKSSFGDRTNSTRPQLEQLSKHVGYAFGRLSDWEEAATVVGWAKRLVAFYQPRRGS